MKIAVNVRCGERTMSFNFSHLPDNKDVSIDLTLNQPEVPEQDPWLSPLPLKSSHLPENKDVSIDLTLNQPEVPEQDPWLSPLPLKSSHADVCEDTPKPTTEIPTKQIVGLSTELSTVEKKQASNIINHIIPNIDAGNYPRQIVNYTRLYKEYENNKCKATISNYLHACDLFEIWLVRTSYSLPMTRHYDILFSRYLLKFVRKLTEDEYKTLLEQLNDTTICTEWSQIDRCFLISMITILRENLLNSICTAMNVDDCQCEYCTL